MVHLLLFCSENTWEWVVGLFAHPTSLPIDSYSRSIEWFSVGAILSVSGHLATSGDILGCHNGWRGELVLNLMGRDQEYCSTSYKAQDTSTAKIIQPRILVLPRMRNPAPSESCSSYMALWARPSPDPHQGWAWEPSLADWNPLPTMLLPEILGKCSPFLSEIKTLRPTKT